MSVPDYEPNSWTCSSNEVVKISLAEPEGAFTFKPNFTYPIFGDSEQIFGYKDLKIDIAFDCESLLPLLNIKYSSKLSNDVKDVKDTLLEYLSNDTIVNDELKWIKTAEDEKFQIPGDLIHEYRVNQDFFKIRKFNLNDSIGLKLHLRMQIFVLLFIEAGSYIDSEDKSWEIYTIYKVGKDKESFVGFSTTYSYWKYPGFEKFDSDDYKPNYKKKISQFIILPPYQQKGHGKQLYECMISKWLKDEQIQDILVEDPSESFDDLRDRCDLERLSNDLELFNDLKEISIPVNNDWLIEKIKLSKMDKRQFERCLEMLLLYLVDKKKENKQFNDNIQINVKNVRLQIKRRLYIKNKDALIELESADIKDKLQTAYERLLEDYMRILDKSNINPLFGNFKRLKEGDDNESSIKRVKIE